MPFGFWLESNPDTSRRLLKPLPEVRFFLYHLLFRKAAPDIYRPNIRKYYKFGGDPKIRVFGKLALLESLRNPHPKTPGRYFPKHKCPRHLIRVLQPIHVILHK